MFHHTKNGHDFFSLSLIFFAAFFGELAHHLLFDFEGRVVIRNSLFDQGSDLIARPDLSRLITYT